MKRVLIALKDDIDAQATADALHARGYWPISRGKCYQSALGAVDGTHVDMAIVEDLLADGKTGPNVVRALKEHFNIDAILVSRDGGGADQLTPAPPTRGSKTRGSKTPASTMNASHRNATHRIVRKPVSADGLAAAVTRAAAALDAY